MESNPFMSLAGMMKRDPGGKLHLLVGEVTAVDPFTVAAAGLSLSGSALLVNAELTKERSGSISGIASLGGSVSGTCSLPPATDEGDAVLLITSDYQSFYVLCKVVST